MTKAAIEQDPDLLLEPLPLSHASIFDAIRSEGHVQWAPHLRAWLATGHAEAAKLIRHPTAREVSNTELWRKLDGIAGIDSEAVLKTLRYFPFWLGGTDHKRMHEATNDIAKRLFAEIESLASRVAQSRVEEAARRGGLDLARDFANTLYTESLFQVLDIDPDKREALRNARELSAIFEIPKTIEKYRQLSRVLADNHEILAHHVQRCLQSEAPTLIRLLAAITPVAEDDSQVDAIARTLAILIAAGSETIAGAMPYGVYELLSESGCNIDQKAWPEVSDDVIRHVSPVVAVRRRFTDDIEIGGVHIRRGEHVVFALVAANHDMALCGPDPHKIGKRACGIGLSFGTSAHVCVGLRIGRSLVHSALSALADAPRLKLCGQPVARNSASVRACETMPMEFV